MDGLVTPEDLDKELASVSDPGLITPEDIDGEIEDQEVNQAIADVAKDSSPASDPVLVEYKATAAAKQRAAELDAREKQGEDVKRQRDEFSRRFEKTIGGLKNLQEARVMKYAMDKGFSPQQHYARFAPMVNKVLDTDEQSQLWQELSGTGVDPVEYATAQTQLARDVYKARARKFGHRDKTGPEGQTMQKVGETVSHLAQEGLGFFPMIRGAGYAAEDIKDWWAGDYLDKEKAQTEIAQGVYGVGAGAVDIGRNIKGFFRSFGKPDNELSDQELDEMLTTEAGDEMTRQQLTPRQAIRERIKAAGKAPSAFMEFVRFGKRTDDKGNALDPATARAQDITEGASNALMIKAIGPVMASRPVQVLGGAVNKAVGATGEFLAGGARKALEGGMAKTSAAASLGAGLVTGNPAAVGAIIARPLAARLFGGVEKAAAGLAKSGDELMDATLRGAPSQARGLFGSMANRTAKEITTSTLASIPFSLNDDTDQMFSELISNSVLGWGDAPIKMGHEAITRRLRNIGETNALRVIGEGMGYGDNASTKAGEAMLSKSDKDRINSMRGWLSRMRRADGSFPEIKVLDEQGYVSAVQQNAGGDVAAIAQTRGYFNGNDGNIYINASQPVTQAATAGHELGHSVKAALEATSKLQADQLRTSIEEAFRGPDGQKDLEKMLSEIGYNPADMTDMQKREEAIAEATRFLLDVNKDGIGRYNFAPSVAEKLGDVARRWAGKVGIKLARSTETDGIDYTEIPALSEGVAKMLRKAATYVPTEPKEAARTVPDRISELQAEIDAINSKDLTQITVDEINDLPKKRAELVRLEALARQFEAAKAAKVSEPSQQENAQGGAPVKQTDPFSDVGLTQEQVDAVRDHYIAPEGMEPIGQRANKKKGIPSKSADKIAEERGREFDAYFEKYIADLRARGEKAPTDPLEIENAVLEYALRSDYTPSARRTPAPAPAEAPAPAQGERPSLNRVFEGGSPIKTQQEGVFRGTDAEKAYRTTGDPQIEDMIQSGMVRSKAGKIKGGREGETHWSAGHENLWYGNGNIIETKKEGLNQRKGGLKLDELSAVWSKRDGKWVDILPEIKAKHAEAAAAAPKGQGETSSSIGSKSQTVRPTSAEALETALSVATKTAEASPGYQRAKTDERRQEIRRTARIEAIKGAVTADAKGDTTLMQVRVGKDGKERFSGRLDPSRDSHKILIRELGLDETQVENMTALQNPDNGMMYVTYRSAENLDPSDLSGDQRKAEYRNDPAGGREEGTVQTDKAIIGAGVSITANGTPVIRGVSVDKYLANAKKLLDYAQKKGMDVGYQDINDPALLDDLAGYIANHRNGFKGDGSGPVADATPTEGYEPYAIPRNRFDVLNAAFNVDSSTNIAARTKGARNEAMEAQFRAMENEWDVDPATGDTNPFRAFVNREGDFTDTKGRTGTRSILEPVWENLLPKHILSMSPEAAGGRDIVRDVGFTGNTKDVMRGGLPNFKNVASGFMPGKSALADVAPGQKKQDKEGGRLSSFMPGRKETTDPVTGERYVNGRRWVEDKITGPGFVREKAPTQEELDAMKAGLPKYTAEHKDTSGSLAEADKKDGVIVGQIKIKNENGDEVGMAEYSVNWWKPGFSVEYSSVLPEYKGKRYGQALYREIAKAAQNHGHSEMTSMVTSGEAMRVREKLFKTSFEEKGFDGKNTAYTGVKSEVPSDARFMPGKLSSVEVNPKSDFTKEKLEKAGFKLKLDEHEGDNGDSTAQIRIEDKDGSFIGSVDLELKGNSARLDQILVRNNFQGKGIGEALYRETANYLQGKGVRKLEGTVISDKALSLRDRLFETNITSLDDRTSMTKDQAVEGLKSGLLDGVKAKSYVPADARFMPYAGKKATGFDEAKKAGKVFKNPYDNLPRFEFADDKMKFNDDALKLMSGRGAKLNEVIDHPELFKQYPKLAELGVRVVDYGPGFGGAQFVGGINPKTGEWTKGARIELNGSYLSRKDKSGQLDNEWRKRMAHEIQHGIQEFEGHAVGSSPDIERSMAIDEYSAAKKKWESSAETRLAKHNAESIENDIDSLTQEQYNLPWIPEAKTASEKAEKAESDARRDEIKKEIQALSKKLSSIKSKLSEGEPKKPTEGALTYVDRYNRVAGEIEANKTGARVDMTQEERDANPEKWPNKKDVLLRRGSLSNFMPGKKVETAPEIERVFRKFVPDVDKIDPDFFRQKPADKTQVARQNEIAKAYEAAKMDNLSDEKVRRAYDSLAEKIKGQWDALEQEGITIEPWADKSGGDWKSRDGQPYKNSDELIADMRDNKHLYFYITTPDSFGSKGDEGFASQNPMMQDSGKKTKNGFPLLNNDILRAVHDAIAHGAFGVQFGPAGEEAAWKAHMATVNDPWARWALTTETRGQNSWVNFRDEMLGEDGMPLKKGDKGYIPPTERPFADQKNDLLPAKWMLTGDPTIDKAVIDHPDFADEVGFKMSPESIEKLSKVADQQNNPDDFGATFDLDGGITQDTTGDVVTLASKNVKLEDLTPDAVRTFASRYKTDEAPIKVGVFRLEGKPGYASIDINVVAPKEHRTNTLDFAKRNGQESIWSLDDSEVVPAGGEGANKEMSPSELVRAARYLAEGKPPIEDAPKSGGKLSSFMPGKKPVGGAAFSKFFHDTENAKDGGAKYKMEDVLQKPVKGYEKQLDRYLKFGSNFQKHIFTSIPGFIDARIRLMKGLEDYAADKGSARMLDITSSEGYFPKAWAEGAQERGADAKAVALDALPAFKDAFNKRPQVPGVEFALAAWGEGFTDTATGQEIPLFKPEGKFDIVHEGMGFQFFTPDREKNVADIKGMLSEDGVFVTLEKFKNEDYAEREKLKDEYKAQFYSKEQTDAKKKAVLTPENENAVGMSDYQYDREAYEKVLSDNFKHVVQVWSSGNFAGYVASDSAKAVKGIVESMGDTNTKFSVEETPKEISGSIARSEAASARPRNDGGQFMPGKKSGSLASFELPFAKSDNADAQRQRSVARRIEETERRYPEAAPVNYKKDGRKYVIDENGYPVAEPTEYKLDETPLAKQAMKGIRGEEKRKEAYTDALSEKLEGLFNSIKDREDIMAGKEWYKVARTKLRRTFKDDAGLLSQLLGATSARTPVEENYKQALDAYNRFKSGEYDGIKEKYLDLLPKMQAGELQFRKSWGSYKQGDQVTPRSFREYLDSEDILPRRSNGKKFNANSMAVLMVLAGVWESSVKGPKTPNFAKNLTGESNEATIDVWAARTLHRMSNEGMADRWRILPEAESGVNDNDFYIGQDAFRKAAKKLGMNPDDLQGVLWFAEKDQWEKNGWTRGRGGEMSDFTYFLDKTEGSPGKMKIRDESEPALFDLDLTSMRKPANK